MLLWNAQNCNPDPLAYNTHTHQDEFVKMQQRIYTRRDRKKNTITEGWYSQADMSKELKWHATFGNIKSVCACVMQTRVQACTPIVSKLCSYKYKYPEIQALYSLYEVYTQYKHCFPDPHNLPGLASILAIWHSTLTIL